MKQLELTATEKAEIIRRGMNLRDMMRHEGWPTLAHFFKSAVERLDSLQDIVKRDGLLPRTKTNIAIEALAAQKAMDALNEWMDMMLREVENAVTMKERIEREKRMKKHSIYRREEK